MAIDKPTDRNQLFNKIISKSSLKQQVYRNTFDSFALFQDVIEQMDAEYKEYIKNDDSETEIPFESKTKGDFEVQVKFGGDVLLFMMHSNVFEFSREHEVMRTAYVKEDKSRSYCGVIHIYNFLADSFKYNRVNDVGYLIGRIFINKDKHYFIEGKRELGYLFNNFGNHTMDNQAAETIVDAAIRYTLNFDLLTPPYEQVKMVSVNAIKSALDNISFKTGKRLGFKFQVDQEQQTDL